MVTFLSTDSGPGTLLKHIPCFISLNPLYKSMDSYIRKLKKLSNLSLSSLHLSPGLSDISYYTIIFIIEKVHTFKKGDRCWD